ncbi:GLPGLI family protein [Cellulophaga lytica]|uniref:GLPGLI family protein n=1 Tax=Cellulophaga lytica TaxID=979 RepID=UPI003CE572DB
MKHFIVLIFFSLSIISAQIQKGMATYKSKHPEIDVVDPTKKPSHTRDQIKQSIKTADELIDFNLVFNNKKSLFYKQDKIYTNLDRITRTMINASYSGTYYSDIEKNEKLRVVTFSGETFIANINKNLLWKITDTTKVILGYTCYNATLLKKNTRTKEYNTIEAWFSKEIPYYFGPLEFNGLPGLILELKLNPKQTIYCTSVQLQSKNNKILTKPTEGTYINSNEEFEDIVKTLASKAKQKH